MSRPQFDELEAIIDSRANPTCLIGRTVRFTYTGGNGRQYTTGKIDEWLGGMRFGILVDGYVYAGRIITVDMHRSEFQLPRATA